MEIKIRITNKDNSFLMEHVMFTYKSTTKSDVFAFIEECLLMEKNIQTRNTGISTRLVDELIQKLFNNIDKWIIVEDHVNTYESNYLLLQKISNRLQLEHPCVQFEINKKNNSIRIPKDLKYKF